ncbi:hypothetical protein CUT44_14235 [Streptomyces carminius]|uniref:Uncharacterized protein n=1 Tax=Streptomyces carminius TaxID=2665496 RepID=A0A2M8LYU2_9ACTN|nr:hypothetical protein [Streptomyces carminius]PJE97137.1 hypothetical protein CUT44_14235 [Streptomyces carminius]
MPSPKIDFRAVPPLDRLIEQRRDFPDTRNAPLASAPDEPYQEARPGAVAARDLYAYYQLTTAELEDAARELTHDQVLAIMEALHGISLDVTWLTSAPALLSEEIADGYGDDEDGPDKERQDLADTVAAWPRLRALAVVEAAVAARTRMRGGQNLDAALAAVGLLRTRKHKA